MEKLLEWLDSVVDTRQQWKVEHLMKDIIALVYFALLANASEWTEIYYFGITHEQYLRKYLKLPNGIPSHDTIQRVFAMVSSEYLQEFHKKWNEVMSSGEGEKIKKILSLDGKTQRGNARREQKANHIVSAVDDNGFCLSERLVDEKSNEITAIPQILDDLNIRGHIITIDAMGTQKEIAKKIRAKGADYMLALKGNHGTLHEEVKEYFNEPKLLASCAYKKTVEKVRSAIETREYWQTDDIAWIDPKAGWSGLKTIAMTRNTITKNGESKTEERYFISSLVKNVNDAARAIRGHWMVESYHWHLDVTFKEDANHTIDKRAAYNLNIIKNLAINTLRLLDMGIKNISLKGKRFMIGCNPVKYIDMLMRL